MSETLLNDVSAFVSRHDLLTEGGRVVVGVSGGVDSMVCLSVLRRLGYEVHAFHANYGLREGADADEALVRRWCEKQSPSVPFDAVTLDAETPANEKGASLQEVARRLRYEAMTEAAANRGASAVATGHHRDDQAETLLLNLVRGSGPEGLAGMRPSRPMESSSSIFLIRPLLAVSRQTIEEYAERGDLSWRVDPTNRSLEYDRGVMRTEVLPLLEEHFTGARETIARNAVLMREYVDQAMRPALAERMERVFESCEEGGWLSLDDLESEPPVWRRRLVLEALDRTLPDASQSYDVAEEITGLVECQVGHRVEVGGGAVWRERDGLRFLPDEARPSPVPATEVHLNEDVELPQGTLRIELLTERPNDLDSGLPYEVYADADRLGTDLIVRTWNDGDRLQPLGLDGSKKVSTLLTDRQVSSHRREDVLVLCTADHVAWVVGHRLDRRVRVRPGTERVARLVLRGRENVSDNCQSS